MRKNKIFWGVFLIVFGALLFIDRQLGFNIDFNTIVTFWPIILILIGLKLLVPRKLPSEIFTVIISILTALIIYALIFTKVSCSFWKITEDDNKNTITKEEIISYPYNEKIKNSELDINYDLGSLNINAINNKLIDGNVKFFFSKYTFDAKVTDSSAYFSLNRNEEEESIKLKFPKEITNEVHLGLHQNVNWSIGINSNFVSSNLNLKDLQLSRLTIKNNFSSYSLYLPGKDEKSTIDIDCNFSSVRIKYPEDSGVKITIDKTFTRIDLSGNFIQQKESYVSNNFENANHKIYITIKSNFSTIAVKPK